MSSVAWRYAERADIQAFYGAPFPLTLQAISITLDGELAGIVGVAEEGPRRWFFSDFRPALRPHLQSITVMRAVKRAMRWVEFSRVPVFAVETQDEPKSSQLLDRLGFVFYGNSDDGERVYVWETCLKLAPRSIKGEKPTKPRKKKPSS